MEPFEAGRTEKDGARVRMNVAAHGEENTGKRQNEEKNSRSISNRLSAALLRPFGGQQGEKTVYMRRVLGVTGTFEKANSHFDSTKTGSGIALPR